jgi:hypothetical protein
LICFFGRRRRAQPRLYHKTDQIRLDFGDGFWLKDMKLLTSRCAHSSRYSLPPKENELERKYSIDSLVVPLENGPLSYAGNPFASYKRFHSLIYLPILNAHESFRRESISNLVLPVPKTFIVFTNCTWVLHASTFCNRITRVRCTVQPSFYSFQLKVLQQCVTTTRNANMYTLIR